MLQGTDRDALVEQLVNDYGVGSAQASADVDAFLDLLYDRGLLEDAPSPTED
jgi:hypothetical protein